MIRIVNKGPVIAGSDTDLCNYDVLINEDLICSFRHRRSEGLSACLRLASDAVDNADRIQVDDLIERAYRIMINKTEDLLDRDDEKPVCECGDPSCECFGGQGYPAPEEEEQGDE